MILCVGTTPVFQRSMVFERLRLDDVNRAASVHDYASGKSVNVARVLHALGENAVATGFAGGPRGEAMRRDLDAVGMRHEFVTTRALTRQCITVVDREKNTATELVEESSPVDEGDWASLYETIDRLLRGADGLVLSGSLPPGAPTDFYASCLTQASGKRLPTVLDTRGEPLRAALRHGGFVVKLNREELASTVGRPLASDEELTAAMRSAMPAGGATVVTLGAAGAIATDGRDTWRVRVPAVTTRSAVGSGDAFAAGLITGMVRHLALPEALALAAACGAANAMTDLAGHLFSADVEALKLQIQVERL